MKVIKIYKTNLKYLDFCDSEYLDDLKNDDVTKENREKIKRCKQLTEKLEKNVIKLFYNSKDIALKKSSVILLRSDTESL